MRNINKTFLAVVSTTLLVSGCSNMDDSQKTEAQGAGLGALFGAVIGKELCSSSNDIFCMAVGGAIGAAAGGAYGRKIAKQKEKYVRIEDFYGNTIHKVSNDNILVAKQNRIIKQNISIIKNQIRVARVSSASSSVKKNKLVQIKRNLSVKVNKNSALIKKYNGNLAYANAVFTDLQKEASQKKKKGKSTKVIVSQHARLKNQIAQLKSNISKLENQNEQLAALDPSLI